MRALRLATSLGLAALACTDDTAAAGDSDDERALIVEPDFGPLCVGATVQMSFADQLAWKLRLQLAEARLLAPSPAPWPTPREDWDPVDLAVTAVGQDGALGPGAAASWALFEGQGAQIFYNQEPSPDFDLLLLDLPLDDPGPGEDRTALVVRVAAPSAEDFVLGSTTPELRGWRTMTVTVADAQDGGKEALPVEACDAELEEVPVRVEFEGGWFEARVALFPTHDLYTGFLRSAEGELDGVGFAQDDPFELAYTMHDLYGDTISTIVRFPAPIGDACGLTFEWLSAGASIEEPNIDWPTPVGHTIDCALEPIDELALSFFAYG